VAAPGRGRGDSARHEIENDIKTMRRRSGGSPARSERGRIYLVSDSQLNSFVAGGQAIFLNTGLILRAEIPTC